MSRLSKPHCVPPGSKMRRRLPSEFGLLECASKARPTAVVGMVGSIPAYSYKGLPTQVEQYQGAGQLNEANTFVRTVSTELSRVAAVDSIRVHTSGASGRYQGVEVQDLPTGYKAASTAHLDKPQPGRGGRAIICWNLEQDGDSAYVPSLKPTLVRLWGCDDISLTWTAEVPYGWMFYSEGDSLAAYKHQILVPDGVLAIRLIAAFEHEWAVSKDEVQRSMADMQEALGSVKGGVVRCIGLEPPSPSLNSKVPKIGSRKLR